MHIVSYRLFQMAIEMEERTSGLKTQLRELMVMNGTGHGVVTMLVQLGSLGRQESSYCRPYRGPVRYHTCGRQGLLQQRVAPLLWRCRRQARRITRHSVYKQALRVGQMTHPFRARQLLRWASHGMEQNVEFGRRRIHLSQDAQRTR